MHHPGPTSGSSGTSSARTRTLDRPRLSGRIDGAGSALVALVAPAGSGKSTALRQWAGQQSSTTAWLGIAEHDDDPVVLARSLVRSLAPVIDVRAAAELAGGPQPPLVRVVHELGAGFDAVDGGALVVDDVHILGDASARLLGTFVDALGGRVQVILSGRAMPAGLRTTRRELDGSLVVLRAADLAFDRDETAALAAFTGADLDAASIGEITDGTRGWAVGVRLAIERSKAGSPHGVRDLDDSGRLLAAYIEEEILANLDADDQRFILESSVLPDLEPEVCDAVLRTTGSADRIARLTERGALLIDWGAVAPTTRYHPLFRDVLLQHLVARDRARASELARAAVAAFELRGDHRAAIEKTLRWGDADDALGILFRWLPSIVFRGEHASLARWLAAPELASVDPHDPRLAIATAWVTILTDQRDAVGRWLAVAEAGVRAQASADPPATDRSPELATAFAAAAMVSGRGGSEETLAHAATLVAAGSDGNPWWPVARGIQAVVLPLVDERIDAVGALRAAELDTRPVAPSHATVLAHLGVRLLATGDRAEGLAHIDRAVDEVRRAGIAGYPMIAMVFAARARACAERHDAAGAADADAQALELVGHVGGVIDRAFVHLHLMLVDAALAAGDLPRARRSIAAARSRIDVDPAAIALAAWLACLSDRVEARNAGPAAISPAEARVLEQLPTHRSLAQIGDDLFLSRNTVKSHAVSIYRKLGVANRTEAVHAATELGLIEPVR